LALVRHWEAVRRGPLPLTHVNRNDLVAVVSLLNWATGRDGGRLRPDNPAKGVKLAESQLDFAHFGLRSRRDQRGGCRFRLEFWTSRHHTGISSKPRRPLSGVERQLERRRTSVRFCGTNWVSARPGSGNDRDRRPRPPRERRARAAPASCERWPCPTIAAGFRRPDDGGPRQR